MATKHGHATRNESKRKVSKVYTCWLNMRRRCTDKKDPSYRSYGGRGITVCAEWNESFAAFLRDMGEPAPDLTLDRIDNDGSYCKENCRWATRSVQNRNKRPRPYCRRGHLITGVHPNGARFCIACLKAAQQGYWKKISRRNLAMTTETTAPSEQARQAIIAYGRAEYAAATNGSVNAVLETRAALEGLFARQEAELSESREVIRLRQAGDDDRAAELAALRERLQPTQDGDNGAIIDEVDRLRMALELREIDLAEARAENERVRLANIDGSMWVESMMRLTDAGAWLEFLKHGEHDHQDWLREAIQAFIDEKPKPAPRGLGRHGALIAKHEARISELEAATQWQSRITDWMRRCFVRKDSLTPLQRAFRFVEEALELAQAVGTSRAEVVQLADYVYSRPAGEPSQEIGGVMVVLAGVAASLRLDAATCCETEIARCEANIEKIRAKDLAKPERAGPLPALPAITETNK